MYDKLGHPTQVTFTSGNTISYVYAADGRKLRAVHRQGTHQPVTTDYAGPYEFTGGTISRVSFPGGYYSYSPNCWTAHYYIQDYQGSNRKVVKVTSTTVEQVTHYYPYGGVIGDISTQEGTQKYKFEGKELDRSFGLDNYDIHARNYFAMLPMWDRVDPLAEKYYGISPYVYCAGDPVNRGDLNGDSITILGNVEEFISMVYNAIPQGMTLNLKIKNGVIDPNSIPSGNDPFLTDFKYVAEHEQMVDVAFADGYDYLDESGNKKHEDFGEPKDTDDFVDLGIYQCNLLKSRGVEVGKSMVGNTGASLYAQGNARGTKSVNGRNLLVINSIGNLNHRSIGFAHELIHFTEYFTGKPYAHPQVDNYLYTRLKPLIHRLGYDY